MLAPPLSLASLGFFKEVSYFEPIGNQGSLSYQYQYIDTNALFSFQNIESNLDAYLENPAHGRLLEACSSSSKGRLAVDAAIRDGGFNKK
jgi:hypothetical protein